MAQKYITENIWYDPEVKNYIMLDVTSGIRPLSVQVIDGIELFPKKEYHCTLVPAGKLVDDQNILKNLLNDLSDYLRKYPVKFKGLTSNLFVCKKDNEMTLIGTADVEGLEGLRHIVERYVPDYALPFPHVTLLKNANSPYGIGINSEHDFQMYCAPFDKDAATVKL